MTSRLWADELIEPRDVRLAGDVNRVFDAVQRMPIKSQVSQKIRRMSSEHYVKRCRRHDQFRPLF